MLESAIGTAAAHYHTYSHADEVMPPLLEERLNKTGHTSAALAAGLLGEKPNTLYIHFLFVLLHSVDRLSCAKGSVCILLDQSATSAMFLKS